MGRGTEKGFRDEIYKNLEAVIDRLCRAMKDLAEDVQCVASITHRRWLIEALTIWFSIKDNWRDQRGVLQSTVTYELCLEDYLTHHG